MFLRIFVQARLGGGYNNDNPRGQIALLAGKSTSLGAVWLSLALLATGAVDITFDA